MDMSQKSDTTKMRRADRAISREDALAVIDRCAYGTLSLIATDGTPARCGHTDAKTVKMP